MPDTAATLTGRARIGTSGFSYASWRPGFYPADTRAERFLAFYAERFDTVEVNSSFYNLPSEAQLRRWASDVPDGFTFAMKMSRQIVHGGRLEQIPTFCERVRALGDRLGPILIRPRDDRPRDDGWLRLVLDSLDPELACVLELRHPTWEGADTEGRPVVNRPDLGAPFLYLRLRRPPYDDATLLPVACDVRAATRSGRDAYAYFRHEDEPTAPAYARRLLELLGEQETAPATRRP